MERVNIDMKYKTSIWSDSEGTQPKYYKDGYWYKVDTLGKEGLAEQLASEVLACSNAEDFVIYKRCEINGKSGCKSASFLSEGEHFVSLQNLYKNYTGEDLSNKIREFSDVKERLNFIYVFVKNVTGLNIERYIQDILALDMLIKNPDRHFGNLGIILSECGTFRTAPIFDNGQGLYQNFQITPPTLDDEEKDEKLFGATVSGSFELQAITAGIQLKIDYKKLYERLEEYPDSIAKKCLLTQLNKYKNILSISCEKTYDVELEKE